MFKDVLENYTGRVDKISFQIRLFDRFLIV